MALKIQENNSAVAYHVVGGAVTFPYAIDAQQAISTHPGEWSASPWSADDAAEARKKLGLAEPEISDEERAAIDEHNKAVAEAQARLDAVREKLAKEKAEADQIAADEALVAAPPPQVEVRRPFGRKGEPTAAEVAAMNKKAAAKDQAAMTGSVASTSTKPEQDKVEFAKPATTGAVETK
jgi:hypothetical protein